MIITPHPQMSEKEETAESENECQVTGRVVSEVEPPVKSTSIIGNVYVGTIPLEGVTSEVQPPIRVVGEINSPKLIKRIDPIYPEQYRKTGVEGEVILEVHTDIYGRVKRVRVLRSINPLLDKAAIDAVFQWKYESRIIDDRPREVIFTVPIKFKPIFPILNTKITLNCYYITR
jgi:protein TonB